MQLTRHQRGMLQNLRSLGGGANSGHAPGTSFQRKLESTSPRTSEGNALLLRHRVPNGPPISMWRFAWVPAYAGTTVPIPKASSRIKIQDNSIFFFPCGGKSLRTQRLRGQFEDEVGNACARRWLSKGGYSGEDCLLKSQKLPAREGVGLRGCQVEMVHTVGVSLLKPLSAVFWGPNEA